MYCHKNEDFQSSAGFQVQTKWARYGHRRHSIRARRAFDVQELKYTMYDSRVAFHRRKEFARATRN